MEYNEKNAAETIQWFREKWNDLPESLEIDNHTSTENLKETVKSLVYAVKNTIDKGNVYMGYLDALFKIRKRLEE